VWRPARSAAGLDGFPFRNLRHTGASLAINAGVDPVTLAARLGHSTTRMTLDTYASAFEGRDAEIAAAMDAMIADPAATSARLRPAKSSS
jgi:integrase